MGAVGKIRFRCAAEQAAVLVLKQHAIRDSIHKPEGLERYIKQYHSSWGRFARDVAKISIDDEELVFVSGFVKTAEWALAAASQSAREGEFVFGGEFGPSVKTSFSVETAHSTYMSVEQRCSGPRIPRLPPSDDAPEPTRTEVDTGFDQCIFLIRYKLKRRFALFPTVLRGSAGDEVTSRSPSPGNGTGDVGSHEDVDIMMSPPPPCEVRPYMFLGEPYGLTAWVHSQTIHSMTS